MVSKRICNLPEELVHEILLRLPVKALLVCKSVCKEWCALIKSPSFVNQHFSHESNQECLVFGLIRPGKGDGENQAFTMYDDERHSLVIAPNHLRQRHPRNVFFGPAKGIFCVMNELHNRIDLLNIATLERKKLPPHPLKGCPMVGFGLDPSSGDFKVVAFEMFKYQNSAFLYNLSSDSWKRIETMDLMDKILSCCRMGIPVLNGVEQYWLVQHDVHSILAFDMRSEMFQVIAIPDALSNKKNCLKITAYGDSLAVMSFVKYKRIDLWLMGSDGLWSKNFCIGPFEENAFPLCVWKKNMVFLGTVSSFLIMCDIFTKKVTTIIPWVRVSDIFTQKVTTIIPGVRANRNDTFVYSLFKYKESLVSIKGERAHPIQDLFSD